LRWLAISAPAYQWERFGKRLAKLQLRYGFTIFHATEYKARRGEFAGWSDQKARALIDDMIELVRSKTAVGIPDRLAGPMNEYQATTLRKLSIEAYQPKLFEEDLTGKEAARRIETLKREIALANSF
jgi:hypothetical protein